MEVFEPFFSYTYFSRFEKSNNFSKYVCPYNFEVDFKETKFMLAKNEYNILNFKKEAGELKLKTWIDDSVLIRSQSKSFYIYEISYKISSVIYSLIGIVGALKLPQENDKDDFIFTCEETLEEEVEENFNFLKNYGFYSSPVCALYEGEKDNKVLNIIKSKMQYSYLFKAKQNNVVHKIWRVDDLETVEILVDFFKNMKYYIVGGTEKYEAAIKYKEHLKNDKDRKNLGCDENFVMTLLFPKDSFFFTTLPVHRLVSGIDMFDGQEILKKSSKYFEISSCKTLNSMRKTLFNFRRQGENAFGLYADDCYSVLSLKDKEIFKEFDYDDFSYFKKFDVFIADKIFLKHILNIPDKNIYYSVVDSSASCCVDCGEACFAVILSAIRSGEFFEVVKSKKKFLKKSFSFFPKPVEGLLFYVFNFKS